ncbi:hypothetical protein F5984_22005 [Rudanella paleaurantiibacter]|uniref:Uncharacterized protein n=1 Tax=Rudanella paleaurantiibacter TaxID=2614655 RepID=A0A7J5TTT8_9BACT|nr:hypothetical protein [Rudanella paleaurantiibacter]KAB7727305.1 hypothetical protein F5984_22005 [Rudanella paleaurantiibacter]
MPKKKPFFLKPKDDETRKKTLDSLKEAGIDMTTDKIFGGWKESGKLRIDDTDPLSTASR